MAALTTPTAASVNPSSGTPIPNGIAGGAITIGHPVYIDTANSNVIKESNADSAGSLIAATVSGIALNSCATGQRAFYVPKDATFTHGFTASEIAPGDVVYLNDTAGTFTVTYGDLDATDWVTVIGQINNPETTMNLDPRTPVVKG